ncbi:MAG: hypothetical protein ABJV04_02795 [Aliiglaciecola sp.]
MFAYSKGITSSREFSGATKTILYLRR